MPFKEDQPSHTSGSGFRRSKKLDFRAIMQIGKARNEINL